MALTRNDRITFGASDANNVINTLNINSLSYPIDPKTQSVQYGDCRYIIFQNTIMLRQHKTVYDFTTKCVKVPMLIPETDALRMCEYIMNCAVNSINFVNKDTQASLATASIAETLSAIRNELKSLLKTTQDNLSPEEEQKHASTITQTMEMLTVLSDAISDEEIADGCLANYACMRPTVEMDTSLSVAKVLEELIAFLCKYITYDETIVNIRGLNSSVDSIFNIIYIIIGVKVFIPVDLYTENTDLIMNTIISLLYDLITDRCSRELFIKGRNTIAAGIWDKYKRKYRGLACGDLSQFPNENKDMMAELKGETVKLLPHIITYSMSDENRTTYIYHHMYEHRKDVEHISTDNWLHVDEILDLLQKLADSTTKTPSRYSVEIFIDFLPKIISMCTPEPTQGVQITS
ncbi:P51 [Crangon crangon nudivirus]|uniref:P51 n=1 Tax=Crangon crangon nudivirus TaxID=2880838 RepID=A0AAE8Y000_9VIRU|nr:P51 [Crangon crangon nudivirus]UBZ25504.1 P51 [Crangon crangon nudivirus]